jgi:hypothetical protein
MGLINNINIIDILRDEGYNNEVVQNMKGINNFNYWWLRFYFYSIIYSVVKITIIIITYINYYFASLYKKP